MVEIERLKIQKFKNEIEICNNVEELSESLKTNIKILKEVLSDEGIECRFEKHNENILIKNFNFNNNTIKHIVIRMLVFQNNVFNGYLPDKTLQMLEKNVTFKEILESEMFLIRMEIYKNSLKQLLKKSIKSTTHYTKGDRSLGENSRLVP